ncbi:MAG: Holliday junction branch migration protein RuvA [Candidatus Dormibacteraceae bacterium]
MIAYLRGRVLRLTPELVVLDVGGVGYQLSITAAARDRLPSLGGETELHVHTHVREDALALFGFVSVEELEMFKLLIEVDGVGPKVGLAILSSANLDLLKRAILLEDVAPIRRAPGVGPRTAQKVIIDLKPKLEADAALAAAIARVPAGPGGAVSGEVPRQVELTLRNLGFSAVEARSALETIDWKGEPSPETALAQALKALGR